MTGQASGPGRPATSPRRLVRAVLALALLTLAVVPWAGQPATADETRKVDVSLTVLGASPSTVRIETGTEVVWSNDNLFDYPVVTGVHELVGANGTFASPAIAPGGSWSFRFLNPGTFAYTDKRQSRVSGQIVVTGEPIVLAKPEKQISIVEPNANDPNSWGYAPTEVSVETGTKLIWRNSGAQVHTVTDDDGAFDSGDMAAGESWDVTLDTPGVYRYSCAPHPWMTGVIRVAAPGQAPPPVDDVKPAGSSSSGGSSVAPQAIGDPTRGPVTQPVAIVEPDVKQPKGWTFQPNQVQIRTGDSVQWTNQGKVAHTATADDGTFDSGDMAAGQTFKKTFDKAGIYRYSCTPHPWMKGVVVVSEKGSTDVLGERLELLDQGTGDLAAGPIGRGGSGGGGADEHGGVADLLDPSSPVSMPITLAIEILIVAFITVWMVDGLGVLRRVGLRR